MAFKFNLPLDLTRLENDKLKLVPIEENLKKWAEAWVSDGINHPHVYDYLTNHPYSSTAEFLAWYDRDIRDNAGIAILAIILKAGTVIRTDAVTGEKTTFEIGDGTFAGLSGIEGRPEHATADLGALLMTSFHRTFVGTNANGLLLHQLLDSPAQGGLGLRRVQWKANASNQDSVRMATRLGFRQEGTIRWEQILPIGKVGSDGAESSMEGLPKTGWDGREWGAGRHTALLALCWDDWVEGGRDRVDELINRP